jgi:hypothetical protein
VTRPPFIVVAVARMQVSRHDLDHGRMAPRWVSHYASSYGLFLAQP